MESCYCAWCDERLGQETVTDHGVTYHRVCYERREALLAEFTIPELTQEADK